MTPRAPGNFTGGFAYREEKEWPIQEPGQDTHWDWTGTNSIPPVTSSVQPLHHNLQPGKGSGRVRSQALAGLAVSPARSAGPHALGGCVPNLLPLVKIKVDTLVGIRAPKETNGMSP